ncbi:MMPL family protein [Rosistilla carotiformis]|uniref:MMPL family protein n=1 Tax=Rosistilla carotiformis TaxID=2528017 RepID=A0A518JMH2_9BACT|nr:MMPL family transporter [Rosistilla carotiformis]QDV66732.1 MMPL family protein [Rosistilla carotiformis]
MISRAPDIPRLLVSNRYLLLAIAVAVFALAWSIDQRLQFDRRIERMFPEADPAAQAYQQLKETFGGNEVAMLTYPNADLFDRGGAGLKLQRELTQRIEALPGVASVLSLAKVDTALTKMRPAALFFAADSAPQILADDQLATAFRELFAGYTHSDDGDYAALVVMLDPQRTTVDGQDTAVAGLREIAATLPAEHQPASLVGEPVLVSEGFSMVQADGRRLGFVTLSLLSVAMFVMFRSLRWVFVQVVVICWSVVCTRALVALVGLQLTLVSSMLTAVVTVIAVASIIHLAVADRNARLRGRSGREATVLGLRGVLRPIAWACLTDAVGFAALSVSDVGPIRDFGWMMAIGALVVLVAIVLFVPGLASIGPAGGGSRPRQTNRRVRHAMYAGYHWLTLHRRIAIAAIVLLAIGISLGLGRLTIETNFIRNFRADHPLAIDYRIVESDLGGAGVWDVLLPAPDLLSSEYLASVRELEDRLRAIGDQPDTRLSKVFSIADADAAASSSPLLAIAPPSLRIAGMRASMPYFIDALVAGPSTDGKPAMLRMMIRSSEQVPAETKQQLIASVRQTVGEHTASDRWKALFEEERPAVEPQVTGYYVLLTGLVSGLVADQWICFGVASLGVFGMLWIVARSLKLAVCGMLPNMLPILGVLALLGYWGTPVNLGTAMIAAVSIGISIDGSIHFLCAYRRHRIGHGVQRSIASVYQTVGIAVILATLSLTIGFSTLATSPFIPTATFGVLVSITLVVSSIANLTLLPFMIRIVDGANSR